MIEACSSASSIIASSEINVVVWALRLMALQREPVGGRFGRFTSVGCF